MKRIYTFLLIICLFLLTACGADESGREDSALTLSEGEIWIYYVNLDKTELVSRPYRLEEKAGVNNQVEALLGSLQTVDMNDEYQSPIPTGINYIGNTMGNKRGKLELEFQIAYDQVDAESMLFFKTCVAKTLLQLPEVDTVSISLRDIAHLDDDTPVVTENFEDDSFNLSYGNANGYSQSGTIVLFFANETGEQLKAYHKTVEITNNSSLARIVVESVIAGPDREGYIATISEDTMIQNISVKDGICYVDLSDEFYSIDNSLKNDIIVYSVVNSLCELPTVSKVQFLKNGEKQQFYRETMPFDGIFERNLDLIEEEEA